MNETDDPPGKTLPLLSDYRIHFKSKREPNGDHRGNRRMEKLFAISAYRSARSISSKRFVFLGNKHPPIPIVRPSTTGSS